MSDLPPGARFEVLDSGWSLSLPHRTVRWAVMLVFALLWNALVWIVILPGFWRTELSPVFMAYVLLFPIGGFLLLVVAIFAVFGRTVLGSDARRLSIFSAIGPFGIRRGEEWVQIRAIEERLSRFRSRNAPRQQVIAVLRTNGIPIRFGAVSPGRGPHLCTR